MKKNTVVIVEDHLLLSQAIAELVNSFSEFEVSYLCKNGDDFLKTLKGKKEQPDIVLMDINMPILNGIETCKILKDKYPSIRVVALSVENDEPTIIEMLKAGAKGYLLKDIEKNDLEMALTQLIQYGYYHTKEVSDILIGSLTNELKCQQIELKEREKEFLKLACSELTYKEIASKMFLSPKTIDGYRDTLFQKLHVKNRIGLVLYAIKNNIINLES
ncbi:response regulator transcription factor [Neptunitalea lumnitzerae]|uniref:DNA-binding response regulator n=1 Tax=Neptunitalea lumnitzerae TaxID=2965509 RepID=A0ABQ5MM65_9FLAO|nr:response regulator transcription factor [Neptunitalea sp. Y10]GLB50469.1 DNA-binding response regulator [Neptunitalea sp. Y10]